MNVEKFKEYLSNRPYITEEYSDEELSKVLAFSNSILNLFYTFSGDFLESKDFEFPLFEEAIYLLQNDPTTEFLTKYEGLKQFNVAGAISATVAEEYLPFLSKLVKLWLTKFGYILELPDSVKINYNYTMF